MDRTRHTKAARRGALTFLLALTAVVIIGCGSSPLEPQGGKTKLTNAASSGVQP